MTTGRILVFSKLWWPEGGGGELATHLITKHILSRHFEVIVVSGTRHPTGEVMGYCRYLYWPVLREPYKPLEWLKLFSNTETLRKLVEKADTIYIPSHTLLPLAIAAKNINPRARVIVHLHNYQPLTYTSVILHDVNTRSLGDVIVELYEHGDVARAIATGLLDTLGVNRVSALALGYADRVVCVSRRQCGIIASGLPGVSRKLVHVYNLLPEVPPVEKRLGRPLLLFTGGDSYLKGFHLVLGAALELTRRGLDAEVLVTRRLGEIGLSAARRLGRVLKPIGHVDYERLLELYSTSYALLHPSIWEEPLPYAVIESMLSGTIPIASRVGGVPEIVDGTPAERFMFIPGDPLILAEKIEEVIAMGREELLSIGGQLREATLRKFEATKIEGKLLKAFGVE
ncbi:glycosyltransferase family 4 protein [Desulfurococcus mucosus]|uniref:Glycosyl transferase group 1 n=1 Tax=Desulfurococcus mucosus (strain ATCC 35584 / DSM 2162 / JCM 9187 / O7/1) TaxID=765177 RepID=E8R8C1_DESM0|nr:glycosyltransferase family 4 protein [Desulfurococcus mucosus]ADV64747.1 glycosyl transferase group 1 [Desulfurococcus mucosus DSM 2162]